MPAEKKQTETKHALLSASAADRWIACPPSARLCEHMPDTTSEDAAKGTLAHKIAEAKAKKQFGLNTARTTTILLNKLRKETLFDTEMDTCTDAYIDFLDAAAMAFPSKPFVALEVKVDYSRYAPEGFGTADCIMLHGDTIHVIDYKHGQGTFVDVDATPQLRLYALGALDSYRVIFGDAITRVLVSIVQPRKNNIRTAEFTTADLQEWAETEVAPAAQLAIKGEGDYCAGPHCKFCRARATCRTRTGEHTALEDFAFAKPPQLSDAEVGAILARAQQLQAWVTDLEKYALDACLEGKDIPGWKAVEGRSVRAWKDQEAALAAAQAAGIPEAIIYDRKPKTLAQLEDAVDKDTWATIMRPHVIKPKGKPALAPASDKRPPFNSAAADFAGVSVG